MVDSASLSALQIFQQEHHPSIMGVGQAKEGLSVFGMLNKCVTPMGRRLLQLWFLRPIINLEVITERQAAISMFIHSPDTAKAVGFVTRLEGQRLTADLQDYLPDYEFAFEGRGEEMDGMYYYSDTTRGLDQEMGDMLHKIHDFEVLQSALDLVRSPIGKRARSNSTAWLV
ncbi:hypothetical protein WJX73_009003 [Symbiochloris irregularis]|uniref:DNA mismatch repair protein MutS core domain-containing protein n=1 Tax=Symbiochloris irregularis TaxID=706552 RepID=A0AAW1PRG1_9CHLO